MKIEVNWGFGSLDNGILITPKNIGLTSGTLRRLAKFDTEIDKIKINDNQGQTANELKEVIGVIKEIENELKTMINASADLLDNISSVFTETDQKVSQLFK